jgi:hypothetical protein
MGDVNQDYTLNIFDLIAIVDNILYPEEYPFTENQIAVADYNVDGSIDISDIIGLIETMFNTLGREVAFASEITVYQYADRLTIESSGFVGLDITLSHTEDFSLILTDEAFLSSSKTEGTTSRIIIADPSSEILFKADELFTVESIKAVGSGGLDIHVDMIVMPTEFSLSPAYPNPFNPVTTLSFALPKESDVSILIYNIQGRLVETLTDSKLEIGYHSVIWNANHHASGLYFVHMIAGEYVDTQKLMLVK